MKKSLYFLIFIFLVIILSCSKKYENPYDRECPPEIWSPTNLQATYSNGTVTLTWDLSSTQFDGYWIEKSNDNTNWTKVNSSLIDPSQTSYSASQPTPGTIYYRVYGIADLNTSNYATFGPLIVSVPPEVRTLCPTSVDLTSATLNGEIVSNGGAAITESGFYYSTSHLTTGNPGTKVVAGAVSGSFLKQLTGLAQAQTYYIRAFATNPSGTGLGNEVSISTKYFDASVEQFLKNYMPIYTGNNPPTLTGAYLISPQEVVYDQTGNYNVGRIIDDYKIMWILNKTCTTTYDFFETSPSENTDGNNIHVQGSGNNFTCHFLTTGVALGIDVKHIIIYSGTKTTSGIQNISWGFKLIYKGSDPTGKLIPVGSHRVFKDSDGLSVNIGPWSPSPIVKNAVMDFSHLLSASQK